MDLYPGLDDLDISGEGGDLVRGRSLRFASGCSKEPKSILARTWTPSLAMQAQLDWASQKRSTKTSFGLPEGCGRRSQLNGIGIKLLDDLIDLALDHPGHLGCRLRCGLAGGT